MLPMPPLICSDWVDFELTNDPNCGINPILKDGAPPEAIEAFKRFKKEWDDRHDYVNHPENRWIR